MIPKDAPKPDWHMYYNDTYMTHKTLGPCRIRVGTSESGSGKRLYASKISDKFRLLDAMPVKASDLHILWPRPGAYNFFRYKGAAFIGRTPQRHMKRSAYQDHYYIQWSPINLDGSYMMAQIAMEPQYLSIPRYMEELAKPKGMRSAALSNKVILYQPDRGASPAILYMGEDIGVLHDGRLEPHIPHDSRMPRIMRHLRTVEIT
jgi:hypothetical protein